MWPITKKAYLPVTSKGHHSDNPNKGGCILWPSEELYEKYPLDPYSAWMEWKEARKPKRWRAEIGEIYWRISAKGNTSVTEEYNTETDDYCYNYGNYFRTKEEAEQAAEIIKDALHKFHEQNM